MASNTTAREILQGPALKAWMKKHGLSNIRLAHILGVSWSTVNKWKNRSRRPTGTVTAALRFLETQMERMGGPEHLIGYDPETGQKYVVILLPPGLVMSARGKRVVWLDPPSAFSVVETESAVARADILLSRP